MESVSRGCVPYLVKSSEIEKSIFIKLIKQNSEVYYKKTPPNQHFIK